MTDKPRNALKRLDLDPEYLDRDWVERMGEPAQGWSAAGDRIVRHIRSEALAEAVCRLKSRADFYRSQVENDPRPEQVERWKLRLEVVLLILEESWAKE